MDKKDFSNLGKDIKGIIKNSVETMDFHGLKRDVGSSVNYTIDGVIDEVRRAISSIQVEGQRITKSVHSGPQKPKVDNKPQKTEMQPPVGYKPYPQVPTVPVGKVSGTLLTVFGSIGIGLLGTSEVVFIVLGISAVGNFTSLILGFLPFLAASIVMEMRGSSIRSRLKRFKRYCTLFKGRTSCSIQELSLYTNTSERFLVKDLRRMIHIGMFPQAHIDQKKTAILLNRESYERYLIEQNDIKNQQLEEEKKARLRKKTKINKEDLNTIDTVKTYLQSIRSSKLSIRDTVVVGKLNRMEEVIGKIVEYVELHPEQINELRRFMDYYLPTTIKLLNAYQEFEKQPIQGENIKTAKEEIQNTVENINTAFENLFDSFFETAAWDVSSDISVLNTMFAQEGLTERDNT